MFAERTPDNPYHYDQTDADVWAQLQRNKPLRDLLTKLLGEKIYFENRLDGVTLENLEKKQGTLHGLEIAKGLVNNPTP